MSKSWTDLHNDQGLRQTRRVKYAWNAAIILNATADKAIKENLTTILWFFEISVVIGLWPLWFATFFSFETSLLKYFTWKMFWFVNN